MHSFSDDDNLVPFYLWWRKTIPKCDSVFKYFVQGCIKNLLLIFPAFKVHEIKIKEFDKKVKNLNEYGPDLTWAAFSIKIILQATVKNSAFWNIVNWVVCQNSIASNINFNIERGFQNIKICWNCKFQGVSTELKINHCFFGQSWTKYSRQIVQFTWKILSREKHFRDFLETC